MLGKVNMEDAVGAPFFTLGTAVSTGVASVSAFGIDLASNAFTLGGGTDPIGISWAFLISIIALSLAIISNQFDLDQLEELPQEEKLAFAGGLATITSIEFIPSIQNLVTGNDVLSLVGLALAAVTYYVIAYRQYSQY